MTLEIFDKEKDLRRRVREFIEENVVPHESVFKQQVADGDRRRSWEGTRLTFEIMKCASPAAPKRSRRIRSAGSS